MYNPIHAVNEIATKIAKSIRIFKELGFHEGDTFSTQSLSRFRRKYLFSGATLMSLVDCGVLEIVGTDVATYEKKEWYHLKGHRVCETKQIPYVFNIYRFVSEDFDVCAQRFLNNLAIALAKGRMEQEYPEEY